MRLRVWSDRLIVLLILLAAWQAGSMLLGNYWLSAPWSTVSRFFASLFDGELDLPRQLHRQRGADRLASSAACRRCCCRSCCAGSRSSSPSSIRSWSAAMARPSSRSRRCSSCGSASASSPRSRWWRRWCSSSSTSARCRACARSTSSWCRWRRWSAPTSARSAATSCFPGAVPAIFAGFRIAVPYAIGGAVIAELISSNRGLGYLVQTGAMNFDTTQVFVAILAATLIVHVFIAVVDLCERFLLRWRPRGAALIVDRDLSAMHATPMLEIKGLGKRFPARAGREPPPWIIHDMSFSVGAGELLTIVGPSGAGKSTLLNIIAQIDVASAGEIVFDGERIVSSEQKTLRPGPRPPRRLCHAGRQPAALAHHHRQRAVPARSAGPARRRGAGTGAGTDRRGRARGLRALLPARAVAAACASARR